MKTLLTNLIRLLILATIAILIYLIGFYPKTLQYQTKQLNNIEQELEQEQKNLEKTIDEINQLINEINEIN